MAQVTNYTKSGNGWMWSGVRTLNQLWSFFRITEPMYVTSIDAYWGGYRGSTKGRHFIAKWTTGNGARLGNIVVQSSMINVPQGRGWRRANCTKTYLEPGSYAVGIWGDHLGSRTPGLWTGDGGSAMYARYTTSVTGNTTGSKWGGYSSSHVIPMRINYESAGHIWVRSGSTWRKGQAWVKSGSTWRRAKGVYVRSGSTWRRSG